MSIFAPFTFIAPEVASITPGPSATVTTRGLVSYYDPNDGISYPGSGSTVYDLQGTNDLTISGPAAFVDSGSYKFFSFPSTDQNAIIARGQALGTVTGVPQSASSISWGTWANFESPGGIYFQTIPFAVGNSGNFNGKGGSNFTYLNPADKIIFEFGSGWDAQICQMPETASAGTWFHIMVTSENVGGLNRNLSVYVNGSAVTSSVAISSGLIDARNNGPWIQMGGLGNGYVLTDAAYQFHGGVGPSYIYNTALSSSEVLDNFNADKAKYGY